MSGGFQDDRLLALGAAASEERARASRVVDAVIPGQRHACLDRPLVGERHRQSIRARQGVNAHSFGSSLPFLLRVLSSVEIP